MASVLETVSVKVTFSPTNGEAWLTSLVNSRSMSPSARNARLNSEVLPPVFVAVEAVTPGEFKERGEGLTIRYGFHPTPFGECLLAATDRGVCRLAFATPRERREVLSELRRRWRGADLLHDQDATGSVAARIFERRGTRERPLTLELQGTNFQLKVWEALLHVPPGPRPPDHYALLDIERFESDADVVDAAFDDFIELARQ